MSTDFEDIRIIGLDETASFKPDPSKALYNVVLELSSPVPSEWAQYFNQRWKSEFYMMKRRAEASGRRLIVHCVPDELEREHLPRLKEVIAETNAAYREYISRRKLQDSQRRTETDRERADLVQLKHRLRFD